MGVLYCEGLYEETTHNTKHNSKLVTDLIYLYIISPPPQDRDGNPRVTGEEWLVKKIGAYLPGAYEEVVELVDAYVLTEKVREL